MGRTALLPSSVVDREGGPEIVAVLMRGERDREGAMHRHARGQLFAATAGLISTSTEAGRWIMPPDRAMWIPPGVRHAARLHGAVEGWSLYVLPAYCTDLPAAPRVLSVTPLLRELIVRAASWKPKTRALGPGEARIARVLLDEVRGAAEEPLHLPMPRSASLVRIARALVGNPADGRTADAWAREAGMAKRTLTRRFHEETGMSFGAWRTQLRVLASLERLAQGHDVTRVAFESGYESASAFIAVFRRTMGTTPRRYAAPTRTAPS